MLKTNLCKLAEGRGKFVGLFVGVSLFINTTLCIDTLIPKKDEEIQKTFKDVQIVEVETTTSKSIEVKTENILKKSIQNKNKNTNAKKTPPKKKLDKKNTFTVFGKVYKVGRFFGRRWGEGDPDFQEYMDQGHIGSVGHKFSTTDGKGTYFAGHNPGIFSKVSKIKKGNKLYGVDSNGDYRVYTVTKIYYHKRASHADETISGWMRNLDKKEAVMLQFCQNGGYTFVWLE